MLNINFVPDDYVQCSESRRTNFMYLILLAVVMIVLGGSFATIKIRQRAFSSKEKLVNAKMKQAEQAIKQLEQLEARQKEMMKAALTTAQLLEPVPKSVLLASLTNNLPAGVSLLRLYIIQKESKHAVAGPPTPVNKYQAAKANNMSTRQEKSREKLYETHIDLRGMAPSDLQVAAYIERLSTSCLLKDVALVESKEHKVDDTTFRQFKLTAMLRNSIQLTKEDVDSIKAEHSNVLRSF
jgi:hypothetical protein